MELDREAYRRYVESASSIYELLLRGHLWLEAALSALIEVRAEVPEALDLERVRLTVIGYGRVGFFGGVVRRGFVLRGLRGVDRSCSSPPILAACC